MPAQTRQPRGRPRASGQVAGIPAIPLTHDELVPFNIGLRIARLRPELMHGWQGGFIELSPYMTDTEHRSLMRIDLKSAVKWAGIGIMHALMESLVRIARGE